MTCSRNRFVKTKPMKTVNKKPTTVWVSLRSKPPIAQGVFLVGAPEDKIEQEVQKYKEQLAKAGHPVVSVLTINN